MSWFRKTRQEKLDKQLADQMYLAEMLLLRAEGELENAQATVDVLRKRVIRLAKLTAQPKVTVAVKANITRRIRNPEQDATA